MEEQAANQPGRPDQPGESFPSVQLYQDGEGLLYLHQAGSNKVYFGFEERALLGQLRFLHDAVALVYAVPLQWQVAVSASLASVQATLDHPATRLLARFTQGSDTDDQGRTRTQYSHVRIYYQPTTLAARLYLGIEEREDNEETDESYRQERGTLE